jgi:hypothetical protein
MQEIGCNPSVDNQSFACVPHPVDDDDDVLENWDDTNNSDDHLSFDYKMYLLCFINSIN